MEYNCKYVNNCLLFFFPRSISHGTLRARLSGQVRPRPLSRCAEIGFPALLPFQLLFQICQIGGLLFFQIAAHEGFHQELFCLYVLGEYN